MARAALPTLRQVFLGEQAEPQLCMRIGAGYLARFAKGQVASALFAVDQNAFGLAFGPCNSAVLQACPSNSAIP
jgi:hypothetical protein